MSFPHHFRIRRREAVVCLAGLPIGSAMGQTGRERPIQLLVGYPAGGGTDFVARLLAQRLSQELDQAVVVVNLPGATGAIALDRVAKAAPDGHSLVVLSAADTLLPALRNNLPFDLRRDLAPVAPAVVGALCLAVHPALPVRSVKDLVALAKSRPGELNFASPGVGNSQHLAGESFNRLAGTRIVHVPYKGGAEAMNAVLSGEVQMVFASIAPALPLIQAGKLRLLAVTPGKRSAAVPDTPTIAEAGVPGYDVSTWFGIAAPAGLPPDVLQRLRTAVVRAVSGADIRDTLLKQGLEPAASQADQFAAFVQGELTRNAALVRDIGLKAE